MANQNVPPKQIYYFLKLRLRFFHHIFFLNQNTHQNSSAQRIGHHIISEEGKFNSFVSYRNSLIAILVCSCTQTLRPTSTLALSRQRLYRASEAPLKLSHVYYNLKIHVLRNGEVNNYQSLSTRNTNQTDWDSEKCITYSQTTINVLHMLFTNFKQTLLNRSQRFPALYKRLIGGIKRNVSHEGTTGQLPISLTINDCLTVTIDGSKRTNNITSLQPELRPFRLT